MLLIWSELIRKCVNSSLLIHSNRFKTDPVRAFESEWFLWPLVVQNIGQYSKWNSESPPAFVLLHQVKSCTSFFVSPSSMIFYEPIVDKSGWFYLRLDRLDWNVLNWKKPWSWQGIANTTFGHVQRSKPSLHHVRTAMPFWSQGETWHRTSKPIGFL